jgi:MFS family permease
MFKETRTLLSENGGLLACGFLLIFFSGFGQSVFFGAYLPAIQLDLDLSKTAIGSIYAAATVLSSIMIIFSGKGLDVVRLRNFVAVVLLGMALGCLLMAYAVNTIILFFAFLLLRHFGQGLSTLSAQTSINRYLDKNRGKAVALISLGGVAMIAFFPLLALYLEPHMTWRTAWLYYAAFIFVVLVPSFWLFLRGHQSKTHAQWEARVKKEQEERNADALDAFEDEWTRKNVIMNWRFYAIVSLTFLAPFIGTAVAFYQHDIAESLSITPLAFASSFSLFTLASLISTLGSGYVIDKYGEKPVLIAFSFTYAIGLTLLTSGMSLTVVFAGMFLLGGGGGMIGTVGGPLLVQLYGTKHLGAIKSLLFSTGILSSALSPLMMGYLQDQGIDIMTQFSWFIYYTAIIWVVAIPLCAKKSKSK